MRACGRIAILALAAVAVLSADAEARHRHRHYRHHSGFDMALPAETSPDRERSPRFDVEAGGTLTIRRSISRKRHIEPAVMSVMPMPVPSLCIRAQHGDGGQCKDRNSSASAHL